jgi:hypothetical protein
VFSININYFFLINLHTSWSFILIIRESFGINLNFSLLSKLNLAWELAYTNFPLSLKLIATPKQYFTSCVDFYHVDDEKISCKHMKIHQLMALNYSSTSWKTPTLIFTKNDDKYFSISNFLRHETCARSFHSCWQQVDIFMRKNLSQ